jgi:hypothetical protein
LQADVGPLPPGFQDGGEGPLRSTCATLDYVGSYPFLSHFVGSRLVMRTTSAHPACAPQGGHIGPSARVHTGPLIVLGADHRIVVEPPFRDPGATAIRHRAGASWSGTAGCAAPGGIPVRNRRWRARTGSTARSLGLSALSTRNPSLLINPNSLPRANLSAGRWSTA